jgi:hypothetical protein
MCMYIYILYIYIYIRTHTYMYTGIRTCISTQINAFIRTYMHTDTCPAVVAIRIHLQLRRREQVRRREQHQPGRLFVCMYMCIYIHTYIHISTVYVCLHMFVCIRVRWARPRSSTVPSLYMCMCAHTCIHAYMPTLRAFAHIYRDKGRTENSPSCACI